MQTDQITLALPRRRPFFGIAHLVLGGLAARLDLTLESLDDMQLALENVLARADADGDVTVAVRVTGDALEASVGPFDEHELPGELERDAGGGVTLRRLLDTVVDSAEVEQRERGRWVTLTKTIGRESA